MREMLLGTRLDPIPGLPPEVRAVIDPALLPLVERLLAEKREDRFASAADAGSAIREVLEQLSISSVITHTDVQRSRRFWRWAYALGAGALVLAAGLVYLLWPSRPPPLTPQAQVYYERGLHYLWEEAETVPSIGDGIMMFNRADDEQPNSALILAALSQAYWIRFRHTREPGARLEAERALDKATRLDPDLPEVQMARALGAYEEGKYQTASTVLLQAVNAKPDHAWAWMYLGSAYSYLGEYAAGLDALEKALELEPGSFRVRIYLGLFFQQFGEYEEALKRHVRATELKPDSPMAWNNRGAVLLYLGRVDEATTALERALELDPAQADARSNLGTARYFLEQYEQAAEEYRLAIQAAPNEPVHRANLGDALVMLGRAEEAREAYRQAAGLARQRVLLEPLSPEAHSTLASYCAKAGDEQCAVNEGDAAAKLQPNNPHITLVNAMIRCRFGQDDESLDLLEEAVRLGATRAEIGAVPEFNRLRDHPRFVEILRTAD